MKTGVLVIGAGVAGLAAALAIEDRPVTIVSESPLGRDLASAWAQGGIAAALDVDDSPAQHAHDTRSAGAGIADDAAIGVLTSEAPLAVATLVALGVPFDRERDGALSLALEGAHARHRVVHVADGTGAAIVGALLDAVRARANVTLLEGYCARRLLTSEDGTMRGALLARPDGATLAISASAIVLATGGFGGLYARTTVPLGARGGGIAMAARAGAALADMEFVQFHPTALRVAADPLPLVSEAVRGEGAVLVDGAGTPLMNGIDARGDLAPRDVVARAVADAERGGRAIFLDARELAPVFAQRFPGIFAAALRAGIDARSAPLPITPAAHYTIGGVATDLDGRSSLPGLWACGEAAATGLHGANRLASNSLVEGLVFGARVGRAIAGIPFAPVRGEIGALPAARGRADGEHDVLRAVRVMMSAELGVLRDAAGMTRALAFFERIAAGEHGERTADAAYVASAVARAALARRESRGAHQRADYPHQEPAFAQRVLVAPDAPALARTS